MVTLFKIHSELRVILFCNYCSCIPSGKDHFHLQSNAEYIRQLHMSMTEVKRNPKLGPASSRTEITVLPWTLVALIFASVVPTSLYQNERVTKSYMDFNLNIHFLVCELIMYVTFNSQHLMKSPLWILIHQCCLEHNASNVYKTNHKKLLVDQWTNQSYMHNKIQGTQ
jgi:hypothetical protein